MTWIELPYPPSVNHYWRHVVVHGHPRVLISREGRAYRNAAIKAIDAQNLAPVPGRVAVRIAVSPPDRRRRDLDNITKAALDVLQAAGLIEDDCQIDYLSIERARLMPGGMINVNIAAYAAEATEAVR